MSDDSLVRALPDLVAFVRRDGTVAGVMGGRGVELPKGASLEGRRLVEAWPDEIAGLVMRLVRRALTERAAAEARFDCDGRAYEVKVSAHGVDRALCVVRPLAVAGNADGRGEGVRDTGRGALERRALFTRLEQSIAEAALRERRLAVCVIHVDGLRNVGSIIDYGVADVVTSALLSRLPAPAAAAGERGTWCVGRLAEDVFAVIAEDFDDREGLRALATRLCRSLDEPVAAGDATFRLRASAGLAVLGEDASRAAALLEHARSAMHEARRGGGEAVRFYSDTLRMHSLARLDLERELRLAIDEDGLALRYATRCDLATGRTTAVHAYLRWPHALRGEVRAAEFLPIADSTGLAGPLSQWALQRLRRDLPRLRQLAGPRVRYSFGALRQHLASDALAADIDAWIETGEIQPEELELRIAEQALASLPSAGSTLRRLERLGVATAIDEFGRGYSSLPRLARLPLHALQLDRTLAVSAADDPVAQRAARAALSIATSLGLVPIATGVDDDERRAHLLQLGWLEGLGDCFGILRLEAEAAEAVPTREPARRGARRR